MKKFNWTRFKEFQLFMVFLVPMALLAQFAVPFDGSVFLYAAALVSLIFIMAAFFHSREKKRFARRYQAEIITMIVLAVAIVRSIYSDIYSVIRLMEVFVFLMGCMFYSGEEDLNEIRKFIQNLFDIIVVWIFVYAVLSWLFGFFGSIILRPDHHFLSAHYEDMEFWQRTLKQFTFGGIYRNGNQAGIYSFVSLVLSIYFLRQKSRYSGFHKLNIILEFLLIAVSGCRSVLVALMVGILLCVHEWGNKKVKVISRVVILAGVAAVIAATFVKIGDYHETGTIGMIDAMTGNRTRLWAECLQILKREPWFGVGLNNLLDYAYVHLGHNVMFVLRGYNNAHSIVFNILAMTGITGTVCFLFLLRKHHWASMQVDPFLRIFCITMLVADCFDIFLIFTDKLPTFLYPLIMGYGYQKMIRGKKDTALVSALMDPDVYFSTYKKKEQPGQQVQKFNALIKKGLENNGSHVTAYTAVQVSSKLVDYRVHRFHNTDDYHYSLSFNIPGIKNIYQFFAAFFDLLLSRADYCVVDVLSFDNALGAVLACRLKGIPVVGHVTDLPEFMTNANIYTFIVNAIIRLCQGYIFLTPMMNKRLNPKKKPWILMEGLVDPDEVEITDGGEREKSIIFAGTLYKVNGIFELAEAFNAWNTNEYELYYYGVGKEEKNLSKITDQNPHIHLMGEMENHQLVQKMSHASLLINPRPVHQKIVEYSFPSKLIEYMNTGTYTATSRLAGIPEEYFAYLGDLGEGSAEDILSFFHQFEQMNSGEMEEKGREAAAFVRENKNCTLQAGRILALLKGIA